MRPWKEIITEAKDKKNMTAAEIRKAGEAALKDEQTKNKKEKNNKKKSEYTEYLKQQLEFKKKKYEEQKRKELENLKKITGYNLTPNITKSHFNQTFKGYMMTT